jgi:hypothetical protein
MGKRGKQGSPGVGNGEADDVVVLGAVEERFGLLANGGTRLAQGSQPGSQSRQARAPRKADR